MATLSYRDQLAKIGIKGSIVPAFPSGFACTPGSLRQAMRAMNVPRMTDGYIPQEGHWIGHDWTDNCQGVACDGKYWYFTSNSTKCIHKRTIDMQNEVDQIPVGRGDAHVGAITHHEGVLYVPLQGPHGVVVVNPTYPGGAFTQWIEVDNPNGDDILSWCAVNPWNGLLYTSFFDEAGYVFGFDLASGATRVSERVGVIPLSEPTKQVQGGAFTNNGHLLLSSNGTNEIRCYSILNGAYLGSSGIMKERGQEVEGVSVADNITVGDGVAVQVHLVLLDTHWHKHDDIYTKHYSYPSHEDL